MRSLLTEMLTCDKCNTGLWTIAPNERMTCRQILAMPLFQDNSAQFPISKSNGASAPVAKGSMPGMQGRQALQHSVSHQNVIMGR